MSTPTSSKLADRRCEPCHSGTPRVRGNEAERLLREIHDRWSMIDEHHLQARFDVPDFLHALTFVNRVGVVAESEGHHPELTLGGDRVEARIWTHAIGGLSENDFILAAKLDEIAAR